MSWNKILSISRVCLHWHFSIILEHKPNISLSGFPTSSSWSKLSCRPGTITVYFFVSPYNKSDMVSGKSMGLESDTWWLSKRSACNARDPGSVPESGRSPGEGDGYPLRYSCLENSMDRGAWWPTVHGVIKSRTRLRDSHFHFTHLCLHPGPTLGKLSDMGKALPAPKPVFSSAKLV